MDYVCHVNSGFIKNFITQNLKESNVIGGIRNLTSH